MNVHPPKKKSKKKSPQSGGIHEARSPLGGADVGGLRSPDIASPGVPSSVGSPPQIIRGDEDKDANSAAVAGGASEALGGGRGAPASGAAMGAGGIPAAYGQMGPSEPDSLLEVRHPLAIQSPGFGYSGGQSPAMMSPGAASPGGLPGKFVPLKIRNPIGPQAAASSEVKSPAPPVKAKGAASGVDAGSEASANKTESLFLSPEKQARLDRVRRARMRRGAFNFVVLAVLGLALLAAIWSQLGYLVVVVHPPASNVTAGNFSSWAAISVRECSGVVRRVYGRGGSIGDAALALTLCSCVAVPIHCGLGGGVVALYYKKASNRTRFIDGREQSPSATNPAFYRPGESSVSSLQSIAVPGFVRGLGRLRELIGNRLPWNALFDEAIQLAKYGVVVSQQLAEQLALREEQIRGNRALRNLFMPQGSLLEAGSTLVQATMARTLENLSSATGPDYFYTGSFANEWVSEISSLGSIITLDDVVQYEPRVHEAIEMTLDGGINLVTTPPPTVGALILAIFGIVEQWYQGRRRHDDASFLHVLSEACKFAFGRRSWFGDYNVTDPEMIAKLSDKEYLKGLAVRIRADRVLEYTEYSDVFVKDNSHSTLPILVSGPNGDVVAILASINSVFGSMVLSEKTGILYNNLMNDFDIPGQTNIWGLASSGSLNSLEPNRRPVSSQAPVFVFKQGEFFAGAVGTGGGYIISGVSQVLMRLLWFNRTLKQAVEWHRVHHQLVPNTLFIESTVDAGVTSYLRQRSHHVQLVHSWNGSVVAMVRGNNRTYAIYDYRHRNTANAVDGN